MAKNCEGCKHYAQELIYDDFYEAEFEEDICLNGHNIMIFLPFNCKHREEEGEENDKN